MALRPRLVLLALAGSALLGACSDEVPAPETPTPRASPEPTPDLPSLTLGPEVALPEQFALLLETGCFQCDGPATGLARVYRDGSGAVRSELLVSAGAHSYYGQEGFQSQYFAGDIPIPRETINTTKELQQYDPWVTGFAVSPDGDEIIVSVCGYPACNINADGWAPPGRAILYRSTDGGAAWTDYGPMDGGGVTGLLGAGRALAFRYRSSGETTVFAVPDGEVFPRPDSATGVALPAFALAGGTVAFADRDGTFMRSDGSLFLALPTLPGIHGPFSISWVAQQPSGDQLIAVGWVGNAQTFVSVFASDGSHLRTVSSSHDILYAVWVFDTMLVANAGITAEELRTPAPQFYPGLLPALIDLETNTINPITDPFLLPGAEAGRNFVRGVQHLSAR